MSAEKLWSGRFSGSTDSRADDFNSSIGFDKRLYRHDILGSIAHARMLGKKGIIASEEANLIESTLSDILQEIEDGSLDFDYGCEDIHMFVEKVLTDRIGDVGKKLHTARSRNDQVAFDFRYWLRDEALCVISLTKELMRVLCNQAEKHCETIMPSYTHLQRAQPAVLGHHLMAYVFMLSRDVERMNDAMKRLNISPLGSCALAGTTFDTDRFMTAELCGFSAPCMNSMDGVSDRDFCIEYLSAFATEMMHLSRLAEETIIWSSLEFRFVTLDDSFTTGSSIMPQKKNSDMAELIRGKTGRVYGDLMSILTVMKGLPLAYNKDMQEDKECLFDAVDTLKQCLTVAAPMYATATYNAEVLRKAASDGFINATDLADYLVGKGLPFRTAYKIVGNIVGDCEHSGKNLETLTLDEYKNYSEVFDEKLFDAISLENCVKRRTSYGGTSPDSVKKQIDFVKKNFLTDN
ncbi:MAG: argininosuccinate lyase [Ruminococcus sp.]|nr:argininosuccinate lyase [Ruminococcus sp.]MDD6300517.1 argininosuccinate lyase [Ruminococcus sp.]